MRARTEHPEDSLPHTVCDAYFRIDDPMPWLNLMSGRIRGKFLHLLRK